MSDDVTAAIGATIYIGDPTWTHDTLAEYDGQSSGWEEIGLVETIPEFGTKWETGNFTPVKDGRRRKYKTVQDNGTMSMTAARDGSDAGQLAARDAADDSQNSYPIKVILGDDPGGTGSKPTRAYFRALVTSATMIPGGAGDTVKTTIALDLTSPVLVGEAAAGT
jgi:hypothetical protein